MEHVIKKENQTFPERAGTEELCVPCKWQECSRDRAEERELVRSTQYAA